MSNKAITARLRAYIDMVIRLKESLNALKQYATDNTVRVNRKKFDTSSIDSLIRRIDEFEQRYGQTDSEADDYMIPTVNELMNEYRVITAPFNITEAGITPRKGTTVS